MLERYRGPVNSLTPGAREDVLRYFGLEFWLSSPEVKLWGILSNRGISQADAVLALLRLNHLRDVELVMGRRITICPPALTGSAPKVAQRALAEARVVSVVPNPCCKATDAWHRFQFFRPGLTVSQLILRGLKRRDLLKAQRWHWVTFTEAL